MVLLPSFSYAGLQEFDIWYEEEITSNTNLWYSLLLENNANFITNSQYRIVQFQWVWNYSSRRTFFRNWTWMYFTVICRWWYWCEWNIQVQWEFKYVKIVDLSTIDFNYAISEWYTPIEEFLNNEIYSNPDKIILWWWWNMQAVSFCFGYSDINKAVCFWYNRAYIGWSYPNVAPAVYFTDKNLWLTSDDLTYLSEFATTSPFTSKEPPSNTVVNPWMCMTIWSIKKAYQLTDDVCYAWFNSSDMFWDSSTFVAGTWLTIFDVYDMYSGWMKLQGWYDTFYEYYKDINHNIDVFSWNSKALMGTFFARQTFWNNKSSFNILNYCHLIFSNLDDNATNCVASTWSIALPDVEQTREEQINAIIWQLWSGRVLSESWDSFTWDILDAYEYSFNFWKSFSAVQDVEPILPWYIIIGFLGIVLLYYLRR